MTTQLPRQLELNLTALSRGFRQALRFAQKNDPQGTEETSPSWRTVAARQAMFLNMLTAVRQFLHPMDQANTQLPESEPEASPLDQPAIVEAAKETPKVLTPLTADATDEELLATLPADIQNLHNRIVELKKRPTYTRQGKRLQQRELQDLQADLQRRYNKWRNASRAATAAETPKDSGAVRDGIT